MLLLIFVAVPVLTIALAYVVVTGNDRVRAVVLAAAAATPGAAATVLAFGGGGSGRGDLFDWTIGALLILGLCFVGSLAAVGILGVPISVLLEKLKWNSSWSYVAVGATVPMLLFGVSQLYAWNFVDSGPFSLSLRDQVEFEGATRVFARNVVIGSSLAFSGSLAAYVLWIRLRSNKSIERTRER